VACSRVNFSFTFTFSGKIIRFHNIISGSGSSVGIATEYGLDGPGSNPGGDETFRPFRPALRPNQPPVQWVLGTAAGACC